jgi:hypothetical protein
MWVKFGMGDLYTMLLNMCEFCENLCSEINTLFKAVHIFYIFRWICKKFAASDSHKNILSGC